MNQYLPITYISAREILDSRGNPTVEAEVLLDGIYQARASAPSGASTGRFEAVELRDGQERYLGLGVEKAVANVNTKIANVLLGENALNQGYIDHLLIDADGTENKSNLGANGNTGISVYGRYTDRYHAGSDDEYFKRRKAFQKFAGFSGIYDYAHRCVKLSGRAPHGRRSLS